MTRLIDKLAPDAISDLAELAMKLAANKDTRKDFLGAVKRIDPGRRFPSQEVDDLREEIKAEREREKEEAKLAREREDTERRLTAQRKSVIDGRGYSDDQIKEVEEVMTKYGITDYDAGADLWAARRPTPEENGPTPTWEFPTLGKSPADFVADPAKHAREAAYAEITRIRRGRAA